MGSDSRSDCYSKAGGRRNEEELRPVLNAHFDVVLEAVVAARKELLRLHRDGQIDDRVLHELERDLDLEELAAIAAKAT